MSKRTQVWLIRHGGRATQDGGLATSRRLGLLVSSGKARMGGCASRVVRGRDSSPWIQCKRRSMLLPARLIRHDGTAARVQGPGKPWSGPSGVNAWIGHPTSDG